MQRIKSMGLLVLALAITGLVSVNQAGAARGEKRELTILHTSGTYNHIQEFKPSDDAPAEGGAARWAAMAKTLRAQHANTILVSPGDDIMGTPMFSQYGGIVSADVMSRVGYTAALVTESDVVAGGNMDAFKAYRSVAGYSLVNANLDLSNLPDSQVPAHVITDVNGMKVGIFGLSHERGGSLAHFSQAVDMLNTDQVIRDSLNYFNREGVDIVVLLSSLGIERDREVAQRYSGVKGIDVIVGNGDGALLGNPDDLEPDAKPIGKYPMVFNGGKIPTLLVYAGSFAAYMGELNLTFNDQGILTSWNGKLHFLNSDVTPDPEIAKYVDKLAAGVDLNKIVIGETTVDLNGNYTNYGWKENALNDLWADIYLEYGRVYGAEISLVNAGSTWGDLKAGKITLANLSAAQPFFNWLIVMDISGQQLMDALENGVAVYGDAEIGSFLSVAGMAYTVDPSKPVGHRISKVLVDGDPLNLKRVYTIAVNGYMADGGDNFTMLTQGQNTFNTGLSITDLMQQYIQQHSPLKAPTMGRITMIQPPTEVIINVP